ncbi:transporter substrate-binding domain-containing protein [Pseudomonas sp. 5P_3.1_Bac2]|nr:sensor histidine kinase [Pseudomonas sp. 5P_3.1_Bac2]MCU1717515.1 transporter substrate-binding domain-containing protein [Pseudomonas sp. 5P_3.1_Bac2]
MLWLWPALLLADGLKPEQQQWLQEHPQLRVGLIMQAPWAQFEPRHGELSGANVELISQLLRGLKVQPLWLRFSSQVELEQALQRGEVDLAPGLQQTPASLRRWHFSDPYLRVPHLVVGERRSGGALDLEQLSRDDVVVLRGPSQALDYLQRSHANLRLQIVSSEREALEVLQRQNASYAVVDEAQLSLLLREPQFASLSVVGDVGLPQLLRIASRPDQPMLGTILEQALQAMPANELERIHNKWFALDRSVSVDPLPFWRSISALLLVLLLAAGLLVSYLLSQRRLLERQLIEAREVISRREEAEQALRLSQFSIDHSTVGILWVNWDSHVRYANAAAQQMLKFADGALVDLPLQRLDPQMDMDRWLQLWRQARSSEQGARGYEVEYRQADGATLPVAVSLSFLRFGRSEYLVVFLTDISERRRAQAALQESEARLQGIAGNVPGLVFRLERYPAEKAVEFAYISAASQDLVGYPPHELQRPERGIRSLVHGDDLADYLRIQSQAFSTDSDWQWQGRIVTRDGLVRWADIKATTRLLPNGVVVWDGIVWDISTNKQVELELADSRAHLRELAAHLESVREEEKARIAREVHDELGQVLTVLKLETAMCELAFGGQLDGLDERLQSMKRLIAQLFQLVRDVATALRPPILDAGIASAIEWQVRRFEARTQIPCLVQVPEQVASISDAKAIGLFRVLQEALTNVLRHAQAHSVQVYLRQEAGELCLSVIDDGQGFAPEQRKPGQSFGLVGMQERVLMLGGELQIDSLPGEGTTLLVRVPVADEEQNLD